MNLSLVQTISVYINNGKTCRKQDKTICSLYEGTSSTERCYDYPLKSCEKPLSLNDCKQLSEKLKINFNKSDEDKYFTGCQISDDKKNIYYKETLPMDNEYIMTNKNCEDIPYYQKIKTKSDCKNAVKNFMKISKLNEKEIIINYGNLNFNIQNKDPKDISGRNVSDANNNVSGCSLKNNTIVYNFYCGKTYKWTQVGSGNQTNTIKCKKPTTEKIFAKEYMAHVICIIDIIIVILMIIKKKENKNKYQTYKACLESQEDGIPNISSRSSKN